MPSLTVGGDITMIKFGMGSPNAAIIMDLLSAINLKLLFFLGKCGGLKKKNQLGDLILPIAAIRGDGTSNDYFPAEIPALPAFSLQKQFRQQYANTDWTTGQVRCTQQTAEFGNMMINLKNICAQPAQWLLIWRQPPYLLQDLPIRYQQAPCY